MNFRPQCSFHSVLKLCAGLLLLCLVVPLHAEEIEQTPDGKGKNTLETLRNLVALQASLRLDMEALSKRIGSVKSESQKQELQQQLSKLQDELNATGRNLENVSAGVDLSALRDQQEQKFDLQEEIFALLKPAIDEMKDMTARIRQKSDLPVIFLTSKDEEIDEVLGLRMGADDYIRKPFSQRLLIERIRAVLRRREAVDTSVERSEKDKPIQRGELMMDPLRHACAWKGDAVTLTVTEFLILQALASRPGFVKSRDHLMDAAYDDQIYVDDRTIDSHIKRIRKKFRMVDTEFDAIETLYGVGYRYKE